MGRSSQSDSSDKFRVDADVENNRLLLWANEIELREIENLLIKLGELPPAGGNRNTRRFVENLDPEEADELLERIRRLWPNIGPNELIIEEAPAAEPNRRGTESSKPTPEPTRKPDRPAAPPKLDVPKANLSPRSFDRTIAVADLALSLQQDGKVKDTALEAEEDANDSPTEAETPREPTQRFNSQPRAVQAPPIRIRRGADGKLMLESQDTAALDQLEDLLLEAAPPKKDFKIFYLKYPSTWAYSVELNLKEFFEVDKKKSNSGYNPFFGFRYGGDDREAERRLSKRKPLKFVSDSDSGTIIVQGATAEQLKIIEELINIYDQPPATDGAQVRKTQVFTLRYSRASVIGEAIKDVYRDLLSSNDKAYQNQRKDGQQQKPPERNYTFIYGGAGGDDKGKQQETPVKFKGLVSLGVDDVSNTVIVSAPESLLLNIAELVDQLDQAARPTNSIHAIKLGSGINSAELQKQLAKILVKPQPKPQQPRPNQPQQPQQQPQEQPEEPVFFP
jgi:hypothetical protein